MKSKGFTLIELMVVMALITILSMIGIGTFTQAMVKSRDSQRKNDLNQVVKAIESFNNDIGKYPVSADGEDYIHCYVRTGTDISNERCDGDKLYSVVDGTQTNYIMLTKDPSYPTRDYTYVSTDGISFALYTALENPTDRDLIIGSDGNPVLDPWGIMCGNVLCNYKITETGLVKSL